LHEIDQNASYSYRKDIFSFHCCSFSCFCTFSDQSWKFIFYYKSCI